MRLGYYGGTFDPPHRGHLAVAQAAADAFALDRILFAPTGRQPLKDVPPGAPFADRLKMLRRMCSCTGTHNFQCESSTLDEPHADGSPNFTIDVLRALQHSEPEAELFVIVGADSFLDIRRWRSTDELLVIAEWIVVSRPGFSLTDLSFLQLTAEQAAHVHLLNDVHVDISATDLRRRLREGLPVSELLTPDVFDYIRQHRLYGVTTGT